MFTENSFYLLQGFIYRCAGCKFDVDQVGPFVIQHKNGRYRRLVGRLHHHILNYPHNLPRLAIVAYRFTNDVFQTRELHGRFIQYKSCRIGREIPRKVAAVDDFPAYCFAKIVRTGDRTEQRNRAGLQSLPFEPDLVGINTRCRTRRFTHFVHASGFEQIIAQRIIFTPQIR
ncbi:hypothetical protein D3C87_1510850 [compost metagenome]